jgi:hypothetical protein
MTEITQLIGELMPVLRDIISIRADNIQELEETYPKYCVTPLGVLSTRSVRQIAV